MAINLPGMDGVKWVGRLRSTLPGFVLANSSMPAPGNSTAKEAANTGRKELVEATLSLEVTSDDGRFEWHVGLLPALAAAGHGGIH
jgi:hypothetical protein